MKGSIEESLKKLESLVGELERGELTLDEALARFEEGAQLAKSLRGALEEVEQRIVEVQERSGLVEETER